MRTPLASARDVTANAQRGPTSSAARDAIAPAAPWIERLARVGYAGKAILYAMVGVLALRAALGDGGRTTGSRGALATLVRQDHGGVVLIIIAAGLFGYAAWRIIDAVLDPERRGTSPRASRFAAATSCAAPSTPCWACR